MAAVCEIPISGGVCGVQAVYRCASCGKAYCQSHQGRRGLTDFIDRCAPCEGRAVATAQKVEQETGESFVKTGRARQALRQAGVPTVGLHSYRVDVQYNWLGRSKRTRTVEDAGVRGWLIGTFTWSVDEYRSVSGMNHSERVTRDWLTVMLDTDDHLLYEEERFALVVKDPERDGYIWQNRGQAGRAPWRLLVSAIRELAGISYKQ